MSFQVTTTRAMICESLGSLAEYLPEVSILMYLFRAVDLNCSDENSLPSSQSLFLIYRYYLKIGHEEVAYRLNCCLTISEQVSSEMQIYFIHYAIYILALGITCLNWGIFMVYSFVLRSEQHACVSGRIILETTQNISASSSWLL